MRISPVVKQCYPSPKYFFKTTPALGTFAGTKKLKNAHAVFACDIQPQMASVFEYGFRLYPNNPLLAHRQDFGLVRWL